MKNKKVLFNSGLVRAILQNKLMSQRDFARSIDICEGNLSTWMTGKCMPKTSSIHVVAKGLGIPANQLVSFIPTATTAEAVCSKPVVDNDQPVVVGVKALEGSAHHRHLVKLQLTDNRGGVYVNPTYVTQVEQLVNIDTKTLRNDRAAINVISATPGSQCAKHHVVGSIDEVATAINA